MPKSNTVSTPKRSQPYENEAKAESPKTTKYCKDGVEKPEDMPVWVWEKLVESLPEDRPFGSYQGNVEYHEGGSKSYTYTPDWISCCYYSGNLRISSKGEYYWCEESEGPLSGLRNH